LRNTFGWHRWSLFLLVLGVSAACSGPGEEAAADVTLDGRLQRLVADAVGHSELHFVLEGSDGQQTELFFADHAGDRLPTGARLRVRGGFTEVSSPRLAVRSFDVLAGGDDNRESTAVSPLIIDPSRAPPPRKLAVVLFNFKNDDRRPITVEEVRREVFTGPDSARAFYKEQSFGFVDLVGKSGPTGDVFGWYTIDAVNRPCDPKGWGDAALAAATAAGADTSGFDNYVFFFPATDACPYLGLGQQPGKNTWINGTSIATFIHEMGHNVGTPHASARTCKGPKGEPVTLSTDCQDSEYGNPFDVMGDGFLHTNAYNKAQARWLTGGNVVDVPATGGTFALLPQESPSGGVQLLRVFRDAETFFYVEYRQSLGFDRFAADAPAVHGVIVVLGESLRSLARSFLLDMNPATSTLADAPLAVGKSFSDDVSGMTMTLVSQTREAAMVKFAFTTAPTSALDAGPAPASDAGAAGAPGIPDGHDASAPQTGAGGAGGTAVSEDGGTGSRAAGGKADSGARGTGGAPVAPIDDPDQRDGGGCHCDFSAGSSSRSSAPGWLVIAAAALLLRRRRRQAHASARPATITIIARGPFVAVSAVLALVALVALTSACGADAADDPTAGLPLPPPNTTRAPKDARANQAVGDGGALEAGGNTSDDVAPAGVPVDAPSGVAEDAGAGDAGVSDARTAIDVPPPQIALYPVAPAVEQACQNHAKVICARIAACDPPRLAADYGSEEFCRARWDRACRGDFLIPGTGETARDRTACSTALMAQSCHDFFYGRALPACQARPGTLAASAPCARNSQCGAGLRCKLSVNSCGTCTPALAIGADCGWWFAGCPDGSSCAGDRCVPALKVGQSCKASAAPCEPGTVCAATGCVDKTAALGAGCAPVDVCDGSKGLYCNSKSGTCEALPGPAAIGDACNVYDANGAWRTCAPEAHCQAASAAVTAASSCVAAGATGQACDPGKGKPCRPPTICTSGICVMPVVVMGGKYNPPACR
jgi:MYXO-CTERM domain-containing protein